MRARGNNSCSRGKGRVHNVQHDALHCVVSVMHRCLSQCTATLDSDLVFVFPRFALTHLIKLGKEQAISTNHERNAMQSLV